jgi:transcriptional regulator with XRE-family HTH domain
MIDRVLELIRVKKMSPSQLADAIGVQRSGISHLVSGRNKPSLEFITRILALFPDINPDWLLFGKTPVFRNGTMIAEEFSGELSTVSNDHAEDKHEKSNQTSISDELFKEGKKIGGNKRQYEDQLIENKRPVSERRISPEEQLQKKAKEKLLTPNSKETDGKRTERIVIFYSDRTFNEFIPE